MSLVGSLRGVQANHVTVTVNQAGGLVIIGRERLTAQGDRHSTILCLLQQRTMTLAIVESCRRLSYSWRCGRGWFGEDAALATSEMFA